MVPMLLSRISKQVSSWLGLFIATGATMIAAGLSEQSPHGDAWQRMLQDAYSAHLSRVQAMLPAHSGLPPLLDLTQPQPEEDNIDRAWENRYKGIGFSRGIADPGVPGPSEMTSIATTFIDGIARPSALPAKHCEAVLIATPVTAEAKIAYTRTFVYSSYALKIEKVLKGKQKNGLRARSQILVVELAGGRLRFPSGHMTSFIRPGYGFLEVGKQYLLFIWTPPQTKTYTIANPYLIEDGLVFPLETVPDVSAYEKGMPVQQFEARVKAAIAKNIDTD